jgi:hypothetical protein
VLFYAGVKWMLAGFEPSITGWAVNISAAVLLLLLPQPLQDLQLFILSHDSILSWQND